MKEFYLDEDIKLICDLLPKSNLKYFEGKKIILTGAYGFLGRYFLKIFSYLNQNHLQNKLQVFGIGPLLGKAIDSIINNYSMATLFQNF